MSETVLLDGARLRDNTSTDELLEPISQIRLGAFITLFNCKGC